MSKEVDERIVKMEFQNQGFQENAEKTIKTLDELEQSLEFKSGISKSLDVVASNFTKMGVTAHRVIQNITDDVYNLGKNITKSLTVDQMFAGFNEYELKMGSTQTIMASTGESLEVVNQKLKELNDYSDKTIYSFRDMTSNIGKFTNAGVKLTPAVNAMKGIANLAAVSGANSEQASHAMYNFAQALSAGYVKLVDWKSIEIANMSTIEFKEQLIDTALKLGTIRKEGDKYITTTRDMKGEVSDAFDAMKGFNDSLSHQWITTEVLTETLGNYASETTDIGKKANKAATELKTFTMVIGALKESAGSGWAQTMEIIFGNYDEAVELWTNLFHRIDGWLGTMADERNKVLNVWKFFSGRDMLIEGFDNILTISESISKVLSKSTSELLSYNKGWRYLDESMETIDIGPVGNAMYEGLVKATAAFRDFTKMLKPSEKTISNISDIMLGFITIIRDVWSIVSPIVGFTFKVLKILSPLLKIIIAVLGALGRCIYVLSELRRKLFNLGPAAKSFNEFLDGIYNNVNSWADKTVELIGNVPEALKRAMDNINSVDLPDLSDIGKSLMEGLTNAVANFKEKHTLSSFFDGFFNTESIKETGQKIKELCAGIGENIRQFVEKVKMELKSSGPAGEFLVNVFETIGEAAVIVSDTTKKAVISLGGTLDNVTEKLKEFFKGFDIGKAIKLAQVASFIVVMIKFGKSLKTITGLAEEAKETLKSLKDTIKMFGGALKDIGKGIKMELQAEAFKNIAFGLGVIVASIIALSAIDKDKLENSISAFLKITAIVSLLVIVVSEFSSSVKDAAEEIGKSSKSLSASVGSAVKTVARGFANSMMISALGASAAMLAALLGSIIVMLVALSAIDSSTLRVRVKILQDVFKMLMLLVAEIGAIMAAIVLIDKIPTKDSGEGKSNSIVSTAIAIFALANAISALILPVIAFAKIDADKLKQGMISVSIVIAETIASFAVIALISKKFPEVGASLKAVSVALAAFSLAIFSMIAPIFLLGSMDPDRLSKGLWALGHVIADLSLLLVAFGVALRIMGKDSGSAVKMGLAFGLLAASVSVFAMIAPAIMENIETIREAVGTLICVLADAIVDSANDVISGVLDLVDVVLNAIDKYLPTVLEHLGKVLDAVLVWLEESLPDYMSQIARIIGKSLSAFSEAAKEHINLSEVLVLVGGVIGIIILVNQISKMSDKIKEATPSLLALSGIMVILGLVINEIVKNSKDSTSAVSAAASLTIMVYTMVKFAEELPIISTLMKRVKMGSILKAIISFGLISAGIIWLFKIIESANLDATKIASYGVGLGVAIFALSKMVESIGAAQKGLKKFKLKDIGALAIVLLEIRVISGIMIELFKKIASAGISWQSMLAYSAGMSMVILSLTLFIRSMAAVGREARRQPDVKSIVASCAKLAIVVAAVGATFSILAGLEVDPIQMLKYAAVMSLVFLSLTPMMKAIGIAQRGGSKMDKWRQFLGQTIELGVIMGGVVGMFAILNASGIDAYNMVGYAAGMSLVFLAMVPMLKALGEMAQGAKNTRHFRQFGGLAIDIVAIIGSLLGIFTLLDVWGVDARDMVTRSIALGIAFAALNPMLKGLGKAAEGAEGTLQITSFIGVLIGVAGIIAALGGIFFALDRLEVDPVKMTDYAIGLSMAFLGLSPLIVAVGLASKLGASANAKPGPIMSLISVVGSIASIVSAILSLMDFFDVDSNRVQEYAKTFSTVMLALTPIIVVIGLLGALFSAIKADAATMLTSGMAVIAVVGVVVLIAAGVIGLLGALNFNGALAESLGKGTEVLVEIANGLGSFVGTLVGAGIGSGLGSFANSAKPFFDMVSSLPDDFADKIGALASGLLTLSGAALIEQIGNLFNLFSKNKDSSLKKLGEDLNAFAPEMVTLAKSLEGITIEQAQVMKYAGEGLKAIIDAMPKEGGWIQKIFGTTQDMSTFATNLKSLGGAIVEFSNTVGDVKEEDVDHAVTCGKMVIELQKALPLTGGLLQWITGFPDLGTFASNLPKLGNGLKDFNAAILDDEGNSLINSTAIENAVASLKSIASIYDAVGDNEGFWTWLKGFPDLGTFADNVGGLGVGLGMFAQNTKGIESADVDGPVEALKAIASMTSKDNVEKKSLVEKATITKEKDRLNFTSTMSCLAQGLGIITVALKELPDAEDTNLSSLNDVTSAITTMKDVVKNGAIKEGDVKKFKAGVDSLSGCLNSMVGAVSNVRNAGQDINSSSLATKVGQMKQEIYDSLYVDPLNANTEQHKAGRNLTLGFANGMTDYVAMSNIKKSSEYVINHAINYLQMAADEHSPSKRSEIDGANLTKGYAIGIEKNANLVRKPSELVVEEAFNAMSEAMKKAYKLMSENEGFEPVIAPVVDLSNARRSASELNNLFAGANADIPTDAIPTKAIKISRGVKIETDAQRSSADFSKIVESVLRIGSKLDGLEANMAKMQVVLDSGELVGGMTPKLMRSIKRQQTNINRGVIPSVIR